MFLLIPLLLINGMVNGKNVINAYRLEVGVPINMLDLLLLLGLVIPVLPLPRNRFSAPVHPAIFRTALLFFLGAIAGSLGALFSSSAGPWVPVQSYMFIALLRNFLTIPAAMVVGYWLIQHPRDLRRYGFWYVVAGAGTAVMTLLFFREKSEQITKEAFDINALRAMWYGPAIAGIAATYLLFQLISGHRQFKLFIAVVLTCVCFLGQAATLSRSDWVAMAFSIMMVYFLLPRRRRIGKAIRLALAAPLLVVFVFFGTWAASRVTGYDFYQRLSDRLDTMLPGRETSKTVKAWDSRLDSQLRELELWTRSPLIGNGFGHKQIYSNTDMAMGGYGHNSWTFTLFCAGPLGFAAMVAVVFGSWEVGRRVVRDSGGDLVFSLIGALGACSGAFFFAHGMTTASFNTPRPAIFLGLTFGVVVRARAMQLELLRQRREMQEHYEQYGEPEDELAPREAFVDEPIFGNWYQPN